MPRMSTPYRQFSYEPEILYELGWVRALYKSMPSIAGALNLPTTWGIVTLCHIDTESGRIINMWSDWARTGIRERQKFFKFDVFWLHAHDGDYEDAMAAPVVPQIGVQNGTGEIPDFLIMNWYIIQLMRVAPTRFPRCNFDTSPPELDAYDFFHALTILRWAHAVPSFQKIPRHRVVPAAPVLWYREPGTERLGVPPLTPLIPIEEAPTLLGSVNKLEPRNALPATSGGDNIGFPKERALSDCPGAPEMLYQFAGKLCEQLRQVRLSVESDQAEKDKEANTQFPGIDGLVEKYAQTIERSYVGGNAANDQALVQLASHCAQMRNQSAMETGRGEEVCPDRDTDSGVKHSGKRFQAAPKTQISRWNNGVSKSRTQPSKVRDTGSNERIQAVFNSALAGTLNSPDQLDAVKPNAIIELDSVIEVDLTED
ncbi:hypothetical protein PENSOL_c055G11427 [Penicillium solitum]|uniref:Uncharacterized protein n=1 Tax=Penicillium solitum TaxID=60172 RepID=A0A1V6QQQ9_9EURO|nr:uncharacterized protein PENSOL_c055G11427 [Penicillium solitum]OQD91337.1 hypothetical protein PENSOL_c055G11427 [Penicillium solitum]